MNANKITAVVLNSSNDIVAVIKGHNPTRGQKIDCICARETAFDYYQNRVPVNEKNYRASTSKKNLARAAKMDNVHDADFMGWWFWIN